MKSRQRLEQLQKEMRARAGQPARGPGRPRLPIDPVQVAVLASLELNNKDIAARLPCDRKTLRRFAAELEQGRAEREAQLKLAQFEAMLAGDGPALRRALAASRRQRGAPVGHRAILRVRNKCPRICQLIRALGPEFFSRAGRVCGTFRPFLTLRRRPLQVARSLRHLH